MANLKEIAQLAWEQLFPKPGDESSVTREQFISTAKTEYALQLWKKIKEDKAQYGESEVPSYLLADADVEVKDNIMDISSLKILRSIDQEMWLQNIGGMGCKCIYIKSTLNTNKILCDDDSIPDDAKLYYASGKKIIFPRGVHKSPLPITYANGGDDIDDRIEVDDAIAGIVRRSLVEIYGGKIGNEDKKNDSNSTK